VSFSVEVREKGREEGLQEKGQGQHNGLQVVPSTEAAKKENPQTCPVCRRELRTRFAEVCDAKTLETFSILECPQCGLGCTFPKPANLAKYYRDYHGGRHGITNSFCTNRRTRILQKLAGGHVGKRLLDIGCGEGTFLLAAKATGWTVAGTEMNLSAARAEGLEVHSQLSDVRPLAPFDCITLWHSLEHMPDPGATLRDARGLLSPGGVLIVAVPDAGGLQARVFGSKWLHLDVPRHLYHFTRFSLESLLRSERFAHFREWHQEFEYDLLGWSQSALNFGPTAPNLFFDLLTGRKPAIGPSQRLSTWVAGCVLTGLAIPLVPLSTVARRGGTLILAARPC
jgi:2-polyprenyl-3-methyl-5-hydroxy-6-metoxy-1,4-benzoquinol methylase